MNEDNKMYEAIKPVVALRVLLDIAESIKPLAVVSGMDACIVAHSLELLKESFEHDSKEHSLNMLKALNMVVNASCQSTDNINELYQSVLEEVIDK